MIIGQPWRSATLTAGSTGDALRHNGFFEHFTTTPEERHDLDKKMGLRVEVDRNGDVSISGGPLPYDEFVGERCMSTYEVRRKPFAS